MLSCAARQRQILKYNRGMLNFLKNYKFTLPDENSKKTSLKQELIKTQLLPTRKYSRESDIEELQLLRMVCHIYIHKKFVHPSNCESLLVLQEYLPLKKKFSFFDIFHENGKVFTKQIIESYTQDIIASHFRLRKLNNSFLISYRNSYFLDIDEADAVIIQAGEAEVRCLVNGYRKIKNSNQLRTAQFCNSIRLILGQRIGYDQASLHSLT